MALHDSYVQFALDTQALLVTNKVGLGLLDVYFGDQMRIPRTPAACVEPGGKTRQLNGLPRKTQVDLTVYIILYLYRIGSNQTIRVDDDTLAESVETVLHSDAQMKKLGVPSVVDSMVTSIESGVQSKSNSLFRASRLTFEARSQKILPFTP